MATVPYYTCCSEIFSGHNYARITSKPCTMHNEYPVDLALQYPEPQFVTGYTVVTLFLLNFHRKCDDFAYLAPGSFL